MDEFERVLLQYRKERFLVVDPQGGKGDKLISMGMGKKLKELDIRHTVFSYRMKSLFSEKCIEVGKILAKCGLEEIREILMRTVDPVRDRMDRKAGTIPSADVILLRGGAYFNDIWKEYKILNDVFYAIQDNTESVFIIAPQSFFFTTTDFPRIFGCIRQEVHLFCREKYSHDILRSMHFPENVNIHLSHDTAFYLSRKDFCTQNEGETYVLIVARDDRESAVTWKVKTIPRQTKILFGSVRHIADFESFVGIVADAHKVYTDKLHVAILSAILGKETILYPNCYHKNKGVYEFSLRCFPNVRFINSYEFQGLDS